MRMKTKSVLGILLSLALVLGIMPGMNLTAYAESADIIIGGVDVNEETGYSGEGWTYDPENHTLTLSGVNIITTADKTYGIKYNADHKLTIVLEGTNTIDMSSNVNYGKIGIFSAGPITIEGTGSLETKGIWYGIETEKDITISGGTVIAAGDEGIIAIGGVVTITGGNVTATGDDYEGIYAKDGVTISGGTVNVTGKEYGGISIGENGVVKITGGEVTAISDGDDKAIKGSVINAIPGTVWTSETDTEEVPVREEKWYLKKNNWKIHFKEKPVATVTAALTANTLIANGSAQELITAGKPEGGTMQYALGKDTKTPPTDGWSASIPTATEAGTYYVWYMVKGDKNHKDSDPKVVEVTIAEKAEVKEQFFTSVKVQQKKGALKISWDKTDAAKVEVYVAYNGKKFPAKPVTSNGTTVNIKKIGGKKINFGKIFKIYLKGYGSNDKEIGSTVTAYVAGKSNSKFTNVKSIKVKNATVNLVKGKSSKISATLKLDSKKKKMLGKKYAAKLRYVSCNPSVATVDKDGNVTGVGAGTCDVYVYAVNGLAKKVAVTVTE